MRIAWQEADWAAEQGRVLGTVRIGRQEMGFMAVHGAVFFGWHGQDGGNEAKVRFVAFCLAWQGRKSCAAVPCWQASSGAVF